MKSKKKMRKMIAKKNARAFSIGFEGGWVHYGKLRKDGTRKISHQHGA